MRSLDTITPLYGMRYFRGMLRTRLCVMLHKHQGGWVTKAASISADSYTQAGLSIPTRAFASQVSVFVNCHLANDTKESSS